MKSKAQKSPSVYYLLVFILVVAFVLRFWNFWNIPFTFDELSAMSRTTFDSFSELIRVGVVEKDTHPAGIQVFMYYWVLWFGEMEWIVKLPFMLAGLASVWMTYRIANLWFGQTNALLSAAYVSSLQLFVMYGQIARPYVSGLFLTLMMVYFWSNFLIGNRRKINLVFFVVFGSLCSYNHHFSLLFAAIVGLSGLFFIRKNQLVPYILSGIAIFILYVPHLNIFFSQLNQGGIGGVGGWLNKPDPWFLFQFFDWLFHYSFWVYGLLIILVLFSALNKDKPIRSDGVRKKRVVLLVWFLLPVIIGFVYSVVINPVLQYSLLIFSTPFLFIFLFSFIKEMKVRQLFVWVVLILFINIVTLIFKRDYYKIFYKQPFEQVVKKSIKLEQENPGNVFIINDYVPYYSTYYFRKYGKELPYFTVRNKDITTAEFKKTLTEIDQDIVIASGLRSKYFQLIKEQFPYWIGYDRGFTFEQYVLSKKANKNRELIERQLIAQDDFTEKSSKWRYHLKNVQFDSLSDQFVYQVEKLKEYDLTFEVPLNELVDDIYWILDYEIEYKTDNPDFNAVIIGEIKKGKELVRWQSSKISDFEVITGKWQKAFLTIDLQIAMKNENKIEDQLLKFYIWNKGHNQFLIRDIRVFLRPGNPERYSLLVK